MNAIQNEGFINKEINPGKQKSKEMCFTLKAYYFENKRSQLLLLDVIFVNCT